MYRSLWLATLLLAAPVASADVRLPKVLNSRMVLQRDSEVRIWGWADAGEEIHVTGDWFEKTIQTKANKDGKWRVQVKTGPAGGPHQLTISGSNRIQLKDILFGEVWIASGQSNMEMPLVKVSGAYTAIKNSAQEVAAAGHPRIRLFQVGNFSSRQPLNDVRSGNKIYGVPPSDLRWHKCSPQSIPTFAATAYFFGRELHEHLKVPIGIIDASWGGTSAEVWTPAEGLKKLGYTAELKQAAERKQDPNSKVPTRLYNGMIHPLRHLKIRGAIWYQGESNVGRADKYRRLFSTMILQWRKVFGNEFSFYYVQIAPFNYGNRNSAFLREAQAQTMSLPRTGMAVTMDIANLRDIHPKNKQEVGRRLALWALAKDYGHRVDFSGPIFLSHKIQDAVVRLQFEHAQGLQTYDGKAPRHFTIAGSDRVFHPATAKIVGKEIHLTCDKVSQPKAVRFAFNNTDMPNLVNRTGLPAGSFRTDKWK